MKADKLGDCASVAVELPDGTFEGPIKKKHLSWRLVGSTEGPGPKEVIEGEFGYVHYRTFEKKHVT